MVTIGLVARFRRLTPGERRLLAAAWIGLAFARAALALVPFRRLRAWAERGPVRPGARSGPGPERAAALVEAAASHHALATTCLARALVLCRLLRRHGWPARLTVGAAKDGERLEAHAWVTCDGRTLTAGGDVGRFEALLPKGA